MKTTIFGAGAVGGHLAARLGAAGMDVAAVCRGAQLAAIRERGITLHIADERYQARIRATDRPETLGNSGPRHRHRQVVGAAGDGGVDRDAWSAPTPASSSR